MDVCCLSVDRKNYISISRAVSCSCLGLNPVGAGSKWFLQLDDIVGLCLLCKLAL